MKKGDRSLIDYAYNKKTYFHGQAFPFSFHTTFASALEEVLLQDLFIGYAVKQGTILLMLKWVTKRC
jgi:hypothetical protein